MVTCPWCGTNYEKFQPNCQNCGGPLPAPSERTASSREDSPLEASLLAPPPPPRPISDRYVWRLLASDGRAIAALVFGSLGATFTLVGVALTLGIITAFVGIPFAVLGLVFLAVGAVLAVSRYKEAQKSVEVLRTGQAVEGQISQVEQNFQVRVNMRNPWVIWYQFHLGGQSYQGHVSTFNTPGPALQPGQPAYVLYLPQVPERNVLYPHP